MGHGRLLPGDGGLRQAELIRSGRRFVEGARCSFRIQGQVADAGKLKAALDRRIQELAPGSIGWLGTTAGVTEDGRFIALARFESQDAARRNSNRPGQDRWWAETSRLFIGEATFKDSSDVTVDVTATPMPPASSRSSRAAAATLTDAGADGSGLVGMGCLPARDPRHRGGRARGGGRNHRPTTAHHDPCAVGQSPTDLHPEQCAPWHQTAYVSPDMERPVKATVCLVDGMVCGQRAGRVGARDRCWVAVGVL